jgi:hypothetical protein
MEFAIPGFIKRFCTPNALLTLKECLSDYASPEVRERGTAVIAAELAKLPAMPPNPSFLAAWRLSSVGRGTSTSNKPRALLAACEPGADHRSPHHVRGQNQLHKASSPTGCRCTARLTVAPRTLP